MMSWGDGRGGPPSMAEGELLALMHSQGLAIAQHPQHQQQQHTVHPQQPQQQHSAPHHPHHSQQQPQTSSLMAQHSQLSLQRHQLEALAGLAGQHAQEQQQQQQQSMTLTLAQHLHQQQQQQQLQQQQQQMQSQPMQQQMQALPMHPQQPQPAQHQQQQQQQQPLPPPLVDYPEPEATHEQVAADAGLFYATLKRVQELLGLTDKVPKVGGKELDLHMLYINVTRLGGCERVISRKQWRDAAESFHFPETITSVSFTLRKAYVSLLWDYEQIYFHQCTGPRISPPVGTSNGPRAEGSAGDGEGSGQSRPAQQRKRKQPQDVVATSYMALAPTAPTALTAIAQSPGYPEAVMVGTRGTVTLDARFDAGYFVTVRVGKQEFQGMLYYPPPEHTSDMPLSGLAAPRKPGRPRKDEAQDGQRRKKDKNDGRDPFAPKPNKTPFNFFSVDARIKAKAQHPDYSQTDLTKKVGEMWQRASEEEKAPYIAMSNQDKQRYQAELESYNYRLAAQAAAQAAQHAAQGVLAAQHAMATQPLQVGGEVYGLQPRPYSDMMHDA